MRHGHVVKDQARHEMPEGYDPSGVPCLDAIRARSRSASSRRRQHQALPGLAPRSLIASVEGVASTGEADWLVWGCAGDRPVLFTVEAGAAAEMLASLERAGHATAIVEPWQLMLERLD